MRALPLAAPLFVMAAALLLSGCVGTVKSVATAPVKAAGQIADWSTTSRDEADRNLGREMRKREERVAKLTRQRDKAATKCRRGDTGQCQRAEVLEHEIEAEMAGGR